MVVNEPSAVSIEKRITFFSSFEEQENDNCKWLASLSPEQNLQYAHELIKRTYAKELAKNPTLGNRIFFD